MEESGMEIVQNVRKMQKADSPFSKPAKEFMRQEKGVASIFIIKVGKCRAYRYDVDIVIHTKNYETQESYTKSLAKGADEGQRSRNRLLCYELLTAAMRKLDATQGFFMPDNPGEIIYDNKSTMYTSEPLNIQEIVSVELNFNDTANYVHKYCGTSNYTVTIKDSAQTLDITDLTQYTEKISIYQEDRSIRTFLEMAVAQHAFNADTYTAIGAGELFEKAKDRVVKYGSGMLLRPGVSKGVRIVQNYGDPCPALVIDSKVSPFFEPVQLLDTVCAICNGRNPQTAQDWDKVEKIIKDIRVEVKYQRNRTFNIKTLSSQTADQLFVTFEGREVSLVDYYREHRQYNILTPNQLRVVIPDFNVAVNSPERYFPLELVVVMEDQRVPLEKMDKGLSTKLLAVNSVSPDRRMADVMAHMRRLNLFSENNPVLKAFKIRIEEGSNKCNIGVRNPPRISFADNRTVTPGGNEMSWRRQPQGTFFFKRASVKEWVVLRDDANRHDVEGFIKQFLRLANERGMRFGQPTFMAFSFEWYSIFDECKNLGADFVMLIDSKKEDTHDILKYFEALYKIVTQQVTLEKAQHIVADPRRGLQTLENILNKSNCKLFGLNYVPIFEHSASRFALEHNKTLVIAYDVAHPPPMTNPERRIVQASGLNLLSFDPSVIGITANMAVHPHNFVGDYYYQESCRDSLDLEQLSERFCWVLQTLGENRPNMNQPPPYIFILRNGLSEGQFAISVAKEMQALREGCRKFDPEYEPKFVYVLGTKRHYKKFYTERGGRIENMAPGSVISTKFVREDCPELFMMSHFPLKGVGKAVEYNILVNDMDITQDELQGLLNSLCFTHQIVNSPVSLPAPVYQADELAKRGRNNYQTLKRHEENTIPRHGPHNLVDHNALNDILSYRGCDLKSTRFTA